MSDAVLNQPAVESSPALRKLATHIRGPLRWLTAEDRAALRALSGVWNNTEGDALAQAIKDAKREANALT